MNVSRAVDIRTVSDYHMYGWAYNYIVSGNFENFVLGMGIYIVFYKGFYVFYVYLRVLGGWAYILFLWHFKNFAKRTTIYIDTYGSPTL